MKIHFKNGSDLRPIQGDYVTTTLVEVFPQSSQKRIPANVMFLVDASSSMGGNKWQMVKEALKELVVALKDDDRVGLVLFDSKAREVFPLASLSQNRDAMREAIEKLPSPSGVTNLEEGLKVAFNAFDARSSSDKVKRVNHVILLTDGFPTDGQGYRVDKTDKYETIVRNQEMITLTGIGIGSADEYDATFISHLSELGRGSYYHANDMTKFKEGLQAEVAKLQSSLVGNLVLKLSDIQGKVMRIAKVTPEIVVYDLPGHGKTLELMTGSMTNDLTSFIVQTSSSTPGQDGETHKLYDLQFEYDGNKTESLEVKLTFTGNEESLTQIDPEVFKAIQMLQVQQNTQAIKKSLDEGDKAKATRLIQNTTQLAKNLGQDKVTRALTRLATDVQQGKSSADNLATIQDESKKTRLLIK